MAEAALEVAPAEARLSRQEPESCLDQLGDTAQALDRAEADELSRLYSSLRLSLTYHHAEQILDVDVDPAVDRMDRLRVRGGHVETIGAAQHLDGPISDEAALSVERVRDVVRHDVEWLPRFRQRLAPATRRRRARWVDVSRYPLGVAHQHAPLPRRPGRPAADRRRDHGTAAATIDVPIDGRPIEELIAEAHDWRGGRSHPDQETPSAAAREPRVRGDYARG